MLKIYFGYDENAVLSVDTYFNNTYEDEWFDDAFVKKIVKVVDDSEVRDRQLIVSPVLGQIPPERLSGGAKALILLYETNNFYTDLIVCGSNCEDLLLDIGAMDKSGTLDYATVARLAYVMAMQAAHTDMSALSDDSFMDWLDTLDGDAILTAAPEIIGAYLSSRATTVAPKNAVAQ